MIRCANTAFFRGDVELAYEVLVDALELFTRLDNKKAIGVALNNLGNTMLGMYRMLEDSEEEKICGFTKAEIVTKGISYFQGAIQLGEKAYDCFFELEGWSPNCLEFMQHLSNRYFNFAIFLLTVKESHEKPEEIEELGFRDLQIASDMDVEIVDEGSQVGWSVRTVDMLFDVLLSRLRGHMWLLELGYNSWYNPDDWELEGKLNEALNLLKKEQGKDSSILFQDLSRTGRMQQIEMELMRYYMVKKDVRTAAQIAIRMLIEDEYVLITAQDQSIEVLLAYLDMQDNQNNQNNHNAALKEYLKQLHSDIEKSCVGDSSTANISQRSSDKSISRLLSKYLPTKPQDCVSRTSSCASPHFRDSARSSVTMEAF